MTTVAEQTVTEVVRTVRDFLGDSHPGGVTLDVVVDGVRLVGEWWHVPVMSSEEPKHTFEYYDALAQVEEKISEKTLLKILLVPAMPDEAAVAA